MITKKKPRYLERAIQKAILAYLRRHVRDGFFFEVFNQGVYMRSVQSFVKNSVDRPAGIPDVLGFFHNRPMAIEVKSMQGRVSKSQELMHQIFEQNGCPVYVCRSVRDVQKAIDAERLKTTFAQEKRA